MISDLFLKFGPHSKMTSRIGMRLFHSQFVLQGCVPLNRQKSVIFLMEDLGENGLKNMTELSLNQFEEVLITVVWI